MNTILKPHLRKAALILSFVGLFGGSQAAKAQLTVENTHEKIAAMIGNDNMEHNTISTIEHGHKENHNKPHLEVGGFVSQSISEHPETGGGALVGVSFHGKKGIEWTAGLETGLSKHATDLAVFAEAGKKGLGGGVVLGGAVVDNHIMPLAGVSAYQKIANGVFFNQSVSTIISADHLTPTLNIGASFDISHFLSAKAKKNVDAQRNNLQKVVSH